MSLRRIYRTKLARVVIAAFVCWLGTVGAVWLGFGLSWESWNDWIVLAIMAIPPVALLAWSGWFTRSLWSFVNVLLLIPILVPLASSCVSESATWVCAQEELNGLVLVMLVLVASFAWFSGLVARWLFSPSPAP